MSSGRRVSVMAQWELMKLNKGTRKHGVHRGYLYISYGLTHKETPR